MNNIPYTLAKLNALPRRKGQSFEITASDLLTLEQARSMTGKAALDDWSDSAVFIEVRTAVNLYRALTPSGRRALAWNEMLGGWFEGAYFSEDEYDADGEFCSTPCHSDDVPSVADFAESLQDCSRGGILFVYSIMPI